MKKECMKLWEYMPSSTAGDGAEPTITYYAAEHKKSDGAVVIFPGGGYAELADYEGRGYAEFLNACGIDAFVVEYRVKPNYFPAPLEDACRSVRFVRHYAAKYGINPKKIAVMGSSAGGHLAALCATYGASTERERTDAVDLQDSRPNLQVLAYPVIAFSDSDVCHHGSMENLIGKNSPDIAVQLDPILTADAQTPPAFIWHTSDDPVVNVKNSLLYGARLHDLNIPFEMHIYPHGPHGMGIAADDAHVHAWCDSLIKWFEYMNFMS